MTRPDLDAARSGDEGAFRALIDPHLHELQVHCYRILGSVQDAEDVLQETTLAAWRGLNGFSGRSSLRTWLYRIATNRCLNLLRDNRRRPQTEPIHTVEPTWLEPYPDDLVGQLTDPAPGPEARYETKDAITLAFVAALQHLPPSQRAVLLLRDVLGYPAAEAAEMLDTTETAVHSSLARARVTLASRLPEQGSALPSTEQESILAARYAEAFVAGDVDGLVDLLAADAMMTMPPEPLEVHGPAAIAEFFLAREWWGRAPVRLVPTRANGQPAFGMYMRDSHAALMRARGLIVLTTAGDQITHITRFGDLSLLPRFGLPRTLDPQGSDEPHA